MKGLATYDAMESWRISCEWTGAAARTFWSYPVFGLATHPLPASLSAWGKITERSFSRMIEKPDWGIDRVVSDHKDYMVSVEARIRKPFCDLIEFHVKNRPSSRHRVLLVAPMSGHYATLIRRTVSSLLPDCEVFVTDWKNARDIPVSKGKFDIEDFTEYLAEFMVHLSPDIHVVAICQPVPLALAATAKLAEDCPASQPRSLILIGGPVDPDVAPTEVTDFGKRLTMGQLEHLAIQNVGIGHSGVGRLVYPGMLQLASFISMNCQSHLTAFIEEIARTAKGEASEHDRHNQFYDEYLAVMDLTAEFYLSTVRRLFKQREIARNRFTVRRRRLDLGSISTTAVKVVEGRRDDISAPGQCLAALDLLSGLPDDKKAYHLEDDAGHFGIFAGKSWRRNIRPLVLDFMKVNSGDS